MQFNVAYQSSYSRGALLLRSFFGWLYIGIPHIFVMMFVNIYTCILAFIAWWVVLITGKYPRSWFDTQVKMLAWQMRLQAALNNLTDENPAIGLNGTSKSVTLKVDYPASLSRGKVLLRAFFGFIYVMIPHGFCLTFRMWLGSIFMLVAWWVVLITGKYPQSMFDFNVGSLRWMLRINLYWALLTDEYPPFSGK